MAIAQPRKVWRYALICTVSSVLGGILGYYIGYALFDTVGMKIIDYYNLHKGFFEFKKICQEWGFWFVAAKGVTPIPYKIVTITAGVVKMNIGLFLLGSLIARATRFYLWAILIHNMGDKARDYVEKNLGLVLTLTVVSILLGFVVVKYFSVIKMTFMTWFGF